MLNKQVITKRLESIKVYMDQLSDIYSKLNIIRIDLGYKKPYSDDISLEQANEDLNHLLSNMRTKPSIFRDRVGYICKREYTKDRGVHIHAVFIYNGQKMQKDVFKADQIGEYWKQITKNWGSYHNCNRNKNKYKYDCLGILDHKDKEKRKNFDNIVISYLCKDEQNIDHLKGSKKYRSFTRGTIPKNEKKKGRPRIKTIEE